MFRRGIQILCFLRMRYTSANNIFALMKSVNNLQPQRTVGHTYVLRRYCSKTETNTLDDTTASEKAIAVEKLKVIKANPDSLKRLQILELEIDIMRSDGDMVPNNLEAQQWLELLTCKSRSHKRSLLKFFWINERCRIKSERKKQMKKLKEKERLEELNINVASSLMYGLGYNTMFLRIYNKTINNFFAKKLFNAMMYGSKLIFDFAYTKHMSHREIANCARQLTFAFSENRNHNDPFYWYFCNVDESDEVIRALKRVIPQLGDDDFPISITREPPISICDKKNLIYLTPDSPNVLTKQDANDVYIIGAFVDKVSRKAISLKAAKFYGIRHARFPLELLDLGDTSLKSLTLNQVQNILLDLNLTGDWMQAFKHVPPRKLRQAEIRRANHKLAISNYRFQRNIEKTINEDDCEFEYDSTMPQKP